MGSGPGSLITSAAYDRERRHHSAPANYRGWSERTASPCLSGISVVATIETAVSKDRRDFRVDGGEIVMGGYSTRGNEGTSPDQRVLLERISWTRARRINNRYSDNESAALYMNI